MSTQGSVGPEGSIEIEVTHDGKTEPVAVHLFVAFVSSVGSFLKGIFS
jgi:hypothetical protein